MNELRQKLERLIALARHASNPAPVPREEIRAFARRTVCARNARQAASETTDPLRLWERVGNWSVTGAVAASVLCLAVCSEPPPANPLDVFGPLDLEETNLF